MTVLLKGLYAKLRALGHRFELRLVSSDHEQADHVQAAACRALKGVAAGTQMLKQAVVDAGAQTLLPMYVPIVLLAQLTRVRSIVEAMAALRHCDKLCTLTAVQSHAVKNTAYLLVALLQHTFTALLPMPEPPTATAEARARCVWRSDVDYETQLDALVLLRRPAGSRSTLRPPSSPSTTRGRSTACGWWCRCASRRSRTR